MKGLAEGWIDPGVAEEFPALRLWALEVPARPRRSPEGVREQLRLLADRFRGPQALVLRNRPVPWAYRVFFRHVGLDPDSSRTPVEALALDRLVHGGFPSRGIVADAITIATMETGVPLWALDAASVEGVLGVRAAAAGERLGRAAEARELPPGRLVVADAAAPVAVLFGALAPEHEVARATRRVLLFSVQVAGVPSLHVEEALSGTAELLAE